MTDSTYAYGTVTVAADGTTVTGTDTLWSGVNARFFDSISIDGGPFNKISSVTDETHLELVIPNTDGDKTNVPYVILWDSPLRFVGGVARADLTTLLSTLEAKGLIWYLSAAYSSPSDMKPVPTAAENQFIFSPSLQKWWEMQDGAWTEVGAPYGMMPSANLSDLTDADDALTNLGGTTVGKGVFTAADMAAALLALGAIGKTKITKFTSSGTFTRDAKTVFALLIAQGAGAAGSATDGTGSGYFRIANGGSAGECTFKFATASDLGASLSVTIPAAATSGGAGGNTYIGSVSSAGGGASAGYMTGAVPPYNGPGGSGGVGDFSAPGGRGASGYANSTSLNIVPPYLNGAHSVFGTGGTSIYDSAGQDAVGYGSGGGPGCSATGNFKAGGNGGPGLAIVIEFLSDH